MVAAAAHITVEHLTMAYGTFVLMRDLNFTVRRGAVFIIMGGSGSGKSTLLRHLIGLNLTMLEPHRSLTILMAQCFSGGFIQSVLAASPAAATYVATAAGAGQRSFRDLRQPQWDSFQRNWITALADNVTLNEAFQYATRPDIVHPQDTPQSAAQPAWAGTVKLR